MQYNVSDIQKEVRALMDMNTVGNNVIDTDTLNVDTLTERLLPRAVRMAETACPQELLSGGVDMSAEATLQDDNGVYYFAMPETFMRLVDLKMTSWTMPAASFITEYDEVYHYLRSDFEGIRATVLTPAVALVHRDGVPAIEIYPVKDGGDSLQFGHYLERPVIDGGKIDICPMCYDAAMMYTAFLVASALRDERAADLKAQGDILLSVARPAVTTTKEQSTAKS